MINRSKTAGPPLPMEQPTKAIPLKDELRLHSRYIRDTLNPLLSSQAKLSHSDAAIVRSIFRKLDSTPMTLDLLRYSRMEKALMVIAATGASSWPMEVVVQAEERIQKWEDQLGPLKNLRADLYGPGGRLEGVRRISDAEQGYERRDHFNDATSAWSVEGVMDSSRAHRYGHLGFQVGHWWLKPAAAFRDGIIDETANAITADEHGAYAIVLTGPKAETELCPDGQFRFHATQKDPGVLMLTKLMTMDTEKVVRVLRSWKLKSNLAPKAGLRYDGLYRLLSYGIHLTPLDNWHYGFTFARVDEQPSIQKALCIPTSDQLDDWKDYKRSKTIDRGDDFAILREMLRGPLTDLPEDGVTDLERRDSGYFSRRESKASAKIEGVAASEDEEIGSSSLHSSRLSGMVETMPGKGEGSQYSGSHTAGLSDELGSASDIEFQLVAEGTPSSGSEKDATPMSV